MGRWSKKGKIELHKLRFLFLMLFYTVQYGIFNMSQSSNTKNHLANDFFNFCGGSFFQFSRHRFALFVAESFSCFCVEVKNVTLSSFLGHLIGELPYALNWYFFTKICSLFSNGLIKLKHYALSTWSTSKPRAIY